MRPNTERKHPAGDGGISDKKKFDRIRLKVIKLNLKYLHTCTRINKWITCIYVYNILF